MASEKLPEAIGDAWQKSCACPCDGGWDFCGKCNDLRDAILAELTKVREAAWAAAEKACSLKDKP